MWVVQGFEMRIQVRIDKNKSNYKYDLTVENHRDL